jgi:hypothetical protein
MAGAGKSSNTNVHSASCARMYTCMYTYT